jgi:hypothetical protein
VPYRFSWYYFGEELDDDSTPDFVAYQADRAFAIKQRERARQ